MKYHMRRVDREIKDAKGLECILKESRYVTIALSMENKPYLVSLSHCYDENTKNIYFHCATLGKKMDYMSSNPEVCGQAIIDLGYDDGKCNHKYRTVMFGGNIEFVQGTDEKRRVLNLLFENQERNNPSGEIDPHSIRIKKDSEVAGVTVGKIVVTEMTGKISGEDIPVPISF